MNIAEIKNLDIANGPGVRVSVFVSGCTRKCPGCFNKTAWDFDYGKPYNDDTKLKILEMLSNPRISGLSLLVGEPFEPQNQPEVWDLVQFITQCLPRCSIWCFTGYTFEELLEMSKNEPHTFDILKLLDVLVDGSFIQEQKNLMLKYRGSDNQRLIDVQRTLAEKEIRLWQDKYDNI